jgi:hypothetical protein
MKPSFRTLLILSFLFLQIFAHNSTHSHSTTHKAFLVKTQLSKEQLLALLKEGEVNLRKTKTGENKEENTTSVEVEEVNNTVDDDRILQEQIEDEMKEDALHPLDEFHIREKPTEVKTFVTKPQTKLIDSLYEKKYGRIYAYLIILLFIFILVNYKDKLLGKKEGYIKGSYVSIFESDASKEYMLVKSQ